jgi:hypothetical protein
MEPLNSKAREKAVIKFTLWQGLLVVSLLLLIFLSFNFPQLVRKEQLRKVKNVNEFKQNLYVFSGLIADLVLKSDSIISAKDDLSRSKLEAAYDLSISKAESQLTLSENDLILSEFNKNLNALFRQTKIISSNSSKMANGLDGTISKAEHQNVILEKNSAISDLESKIKKLESKLEDCGC